MSKADQAPSATGGRRTEVLSSPSIREELLYLSRLCGLRRTDQLNTRCVGLLLRKAPLAPSGARTSKSRSSDICHCAHNPLAFLAFGYFSTLCHPPPTTDRQDDDQMPHRPQPLSIVLLLRRGKNESFAPSTREIVLLSVHPAPPNLNSLNRIVGISTKMGRNLASRTTLVVLDGFKDPSDISVERWRC